MLPKAAQLVSFDTGWMVGLSFSESLHCYIGKGVSRSIVQSEHGPWGCRSSLLDVSKDIKPRSSYVGVPAEQQSANILGITVEVDNDRLVCSEETVESFLCKSMWVLTGCSKDQQVVNVDDSDLDSVVAE